MHDPYVTGALLREPDDLGQFRRALDADLSRRNADYLAHRAEGVGLPMPAMLVARPGGFDAWMRSRGKLGGQHKVPRMDNTGTLTAEIVANLRDSGQVASELAKHPAAYPQILTTSARLGGGIEELRAAVARLLAG